MSMYLWSCDIKWYEDVGFEVWLKLWSLVICVKNE